MDLKTLMQTRPNELARLQYTELRKHTISILEEVKRLIEQEDYDGVKALCLPSPAGDGYGRDNDFINFDYSSCPEGRDIAEICEILSALRKQGGSVFNRSNDK